MKLAISNIAWPADQDAAVAELLPQAGVQGIEVAPTRIWPVPLAATDTAVQAYRRFWESSGLPIVAAQALLFGRPELTLFDSAAVRGQTLAYLSGIIRLCASLGAAALVFGAPKNRRVGTLGQDAAWPIAVDFFGRLGDCAVREGTTVVIEANPPAYGADFLTSALEAARLVRAVAHPGLRLHLDSACMALAGDPVHEVLLTGFDLVRHYHVSDVQLGSIGSSLVDHTRYAQELRGRGYAHWLSIEMRQAEPFTLESLAAGIRCTQQLYAS